MKIAFNQSIQNLGEYNSTRLHTMDIVSGKEYRRIRRKDKKKSFTYLTKNFN